MDLKPYDANDGVPRQQENSFKIFVGVDRMAIAGNAVIELIPTSTSIAGIHLYGNNSPKIKSSDCFCRYFSATKKRWAVTVPPPGCY